MLYIMGENLCYLHIYNELLSIAHKELDIPNPNKSIIKLNKKMDSCQKVN